jgi:pSer/pThr/pTyr-binding forkhead associated (FHA) protein
LIGPDQLERHERGEAMSYQNLSSPQLIIEHTGQVFPLGTDVVTIGRSDDNLIVLADPAVSAHHSRIAWDARRGVYTIEDLGSVEGTFVNERSIGGPVKLHHGDIIRVGNTIMGLSWQMGYVPPLEEEEEEERRSFPFLVVIVAAILAGITVLCLVLLAVLLLSGEQGVPDVTIQSPADNSRIVASTTVILQATASGARDITLLELSVDGVLVATASSASPAGSSLLTASKSWSFDRPGQHQVSAEAFTAQGKVSKPATVAVTIVAAADDAPTAEITNTPSPTPTLEATASPTPTLQPTATATPPPPPQIEYFQANPGSIYAGECTTLQWGNVSNWSEVTVEPGIGRVNAPGSERVCPQQTTTYVLTASGPGGTNSASTTVSVAPVLPDLVVESISIVPDPAVQGQSIEVSLALRNLGLGAAGPFDWRWQAGSEAAFDGRVARLGPGERTVVRLIWQPASASDSLTTLALVDVRGEVVESDEGNNQLETAVRVVEPPRQPQTLRLTSEDSLDGFLLNDGSGSTAQQIVIGNGKIEDSVGELVARGFMSFDLAELPAGATIESVELRFYQESIQGNPYAKLGNLVLERVDLGSNLDASDFSTPALDSGTIPQQTLPAVWYVISDPTLVTWVEREASAGRSRLQLRLRFSQETDGDGEQDLVSLSGGGAQNAPQLIVVYIP